MPLRKRLRQSWNGYAHDEVWKQAAAKTLMRFLWKNIEIRDYNMGSGYSVKAISFMEFGKVATFQIGADYYRIFTWKGYEGKDLATTDPLYLNAQGDKGNASLLVLNARFGLALSNRLNLDFNVSNYWRDTHYSYHDDAPVLHCPRHRLRCCRNMFGGVRIPICGDG